MLPAPGAVAFIEYVPVVPLAVKVGAVATPLAFVVDVANRVPVPGNTPPAPPPAGFAVQVTVIPLTTGLTVAVIGVANDVLTAVV